MSALQSIIKEAKSLRAKYPKRYSKWTDYVKQASAIYASKHKGKSPVGKKKATKKPTKKKVGAAKPISKHKDTKSHNVNIRVLSGVGALPVGFKGSILGINFKVINQFDIYNNVAAIVEDVKNGATITIIDGSSNYKNKADQFESYIKNQTNESKYNFPKDLKSRIDKFVSNLNTEVKKYNSGKKATTKKKPLIIKKVITKKAATKQPKKKVTKKNTITKVKQVLKQDKKRLTHGYNLTSGSVRIGVIKSMEMEQYHQTINKIDILEKSLINNLIAYKQAKNLEHKKIIQQQIFQIKKYLSELKIQKTELKKLL
jgi:hypothetical protein